MTETSQGSGSTDLQPWSAEDNVGLEDIDASDLVIPRLRIDHEKGLFEEKNSGFSTPLLDCVLLGIVKQRIFWRGDVEEGDRPACKSSDFEHGFPNFSDNVPRDKRFPWAESNFDQEHFPADQDFNGHVTLPCASCAFKEWTTKDGKSVPPLCSDQHTYPLLYTPDEGQSWLTALLTLQKTGIKPSKQYISSFAQMNRPLFTVRTELRLDIVKRGTVTYSVPKFKRGEATEQLQWGAYGETMRNVRSFIRQPPRRDEDDAEVASAPADDPWAGSTPPATPAPAASVAAPAPTPAPAPAAAATPAPVAPTERPAAPVVPAAPVPTPAVVTAPAAPTVSVEDDDDPLPF